MKQKNKEIEQPKRIYSTSIINELIKDINRGYDVDTSPFFDRDIELRAANVVFKLTSDEYEEFKKCAMDAEYFISKYCKFLTDKGRRLVTLYPHQNKIIKSVTAQHYDETIDEFVPNNRNIIIMASRQTGKTTTTAAYMSWYLCFHTDRNVGIMANKEKTAKEIVDKVTQVFKGLPYFLKPGCLNFGKFGFSLDNGCNLISSATTASASIGFTLNGILYLDEFAHIPKNIMDPFWRSVYPTLSSSNVAQCIITSTPNGMDNKFFDIWDKANREENSFIPIRVDYWEVPGHDEAWAEQFKKDLGEEEFAQEFQLQFNVSSSMLIKSSDLSFINKIKKEYRYVEIEGLEKYENLKWVEGFNPNNISDNDYFLFSIDTAEGKEEGEKKKDNDSNIVNIFKIVPNSRANIKRLFNKENDETSIKSCFRLIQVGQYEDKFKDEAAAAILTRTLIFDVFKCGIMNPSTQFIRDNCRVLIEMNFNGKNFLTHFSSHPLYYEDVIISTYHTKPIPGETPKRKLGYKTTPGNKNYYCDKGIKLISNKIIIVNNPDALKQLSTFGKDKSGKYKGIASHDDIAMTILNLSRAFDEDIFEEWLNNIFDNLQDEAVKYYINSLLERYAMDNPEMSDEQFNALYGLNSSIPYINNSFSSNYPNYTYSQINNMI